MSRRPEQHAHGVQVVGHARHDVAGAVALVEARVLRFQLRNRSLRRSNSMSREMPIRIQRCAYRNTPLTRVMPTRSSGKEQNVLAGCPVLDRVHRHAQNPGKLARRRCSWKRRPISPHVSPAVAAHVGVKWAKVAKHSSIVRFARFEPKPRAGCQVSGVRLQIPGKSCSPFTIHGPRCAACGFKSLSP